MEITIALGAIGLYGLAHLIFYLGMRQGRVRAIGEALDVGTWIEFRKDVCVPQAGAQPVTIQAGTQAIIVSESRGNGALVLIAEPWRKLLNSDKTYYAISDLGGIAIVPLSRVPTDLRTKTIEELNHFLRSNAALERQV